MKNSKLFAAAGLGALVVVGGTFAYYNTTQTFNNPFNTTDYGTYVTEHFNVDDGSEWKPGATVAKEITATNTGDGKVWVRVKFDEKWYRGTEATKESIFKEITSGNDKFNPTGTTDSAGKPLAGSEYQPGTTMVDGKAVYNGNTDGLTDADGSVVYKKLENVTTDSSELGKWFKSGDYYYYTSALGKNDSSDVLLNGVTLCADTDMGETAHKAAYIVLPKNTDRVKVPSFLEDMDTTEAGVQFQEGETSYTWVECPEENLPKPMAKPAADATDEAKAAYEAYKAAFGGKDIYTYKSEELTGNKGYAGANYQLDITVELVQADEEKTAAKSLDWDLKALNYASKPKKESETP